jgi:CHAD domain-containing protein
MPESSPATPVALRPPQISLAPDACAVTAAMEAFAAGVAALHFYERGALLGEVDAVHQFRVSIRRLRAAVELLAPVLHGARVRFYRRELPVVGRAAGAVRDCDALAELIRKNSEALDPLTARALTPAYQTLADQRVAAMRELIAFMNSPRYREVVARLSPTLTRKLPASVTVLARAPMFIRPVVRTAGRAGARLAADSPPPVFHNLRTRLKRLRYSIEMLDRLAGKRTSKALKRLRLMQEELGELQDLVNTASWLRGFGKRPAVPPETLIATGALLQFVSHRRVKVAERACRHWKKFEHGALMDKAVTEIVGQAHAPQSAATKSRDAT